MWAAAFAGMCMRICLKLLAGFAGALTANGDHCVVLFRDGCFTRSVKSRDDDAPSHYTGDGFSLLPSFIPWVEQLKWVRLRPEIIYNI